MKLIDLGLVRIEHVSQSLTRTGVTVGTPGYMAPEQARGERRIGPPADVFSLGCVLFRCLTGQAPFEGTHFVAVLTKVLLAQAPRTRSLRPDIPEALDALVARMLAKDPFARPAGASEVAAELRAIAAGPLLAPSDEVPMPRSLRLGGLTESEQRIVTVLVAGSAGGAGDEALREIAERFGADLDHAADGTRLLTASRDPSALDQASRLARCALAIAAALPDAPLAIATGWSLGTGSAVSGEIIERARDLFAARGPGGVVLDEVSAALLDGRSRSGAACPQSPPRGPPRRGARGAHAPRAAHRVPRARVGAVDDRLPARRRHRRVAGGGAGVHRPDRGGQVPARHGSRRGGAGAPARSHGVDRPRRVRARRGAARPPGPDRARRVRPRPRETRPPSSGAGSRPAWRT